MYTQIMKVLDNIENFWYEVTKYSGLAWLVSSVASRETIQALSWDILWIWLATRLLPKAIKYVTKSSTDVAKTLSASK